ncbi:unnamed protein product [Linum tenue]|uniref:Uncharacterized protein n=1 Tax=Linum tenue TaxID=586396 RepID=A0AAV0IFP7_9ROSI|nr:unnamed protein product [Linum tenue]
MSSSMSYIFSIHQSTSQSPSCNLVSASPLPSTRPRLASFQCTHLPNSTAPTEQVQGSASRQPTRTPPQLRVFSFSSVSYVSFSFLWYALARSGDSAIRAIRTRLVNLETGRRYFSGMRESVKNLGFHCCIFFIQLMTSMLLNAMSLAPVETNAILSMYLQN